MKIIANLHSKREVVPRVVKINIALLKTEDRTRDLF